MSDLVTWTEERIEQLRTLWVQNPDGGPGTDSGSLGSCHQCVKLVS